MQWIKFWLPYLRSASNSTTSYMSMMPLSLGASVFSLIKWRAIHPIIEWMFMDCLLCARHYIGYAWGTDKLPSCRTERFDWAKACEIPHHQGLEEGENLLLRYDNSSQCHIQHKKVMLYPRKSVILLKYCSQSSVYINICI